MNDVDITPEQKAFLIRDKIFEFSDGFINFLTNPYVKYGDIEEDETKIKKFLRDIRYDTGKGNKKSTRYRTIKRILENRGYYYGRSLTEDEVQVNGLIERLELLILETKAGHDGLYDEKLKISKQILSMKTINKEQIDKFVFN